MHSTNTPLRTKNRLRAWLETDYFPNTERLLRRTVYTPLGGLSLAALAALMGGLFLHPNGIVVFAGLSGLILMGVLWPWIALRGISGTIQFSRSRIHEDSAVEVLLTIENRQPWAVWGLAVRGGFCEKEIPGTKEGPLPAVSLSIANRRVKSTQRWTFEPPLRGVYPNQTSYITTGFPFGLRESKRRLTIQEALLVWPKVFPVGPAPLSEGENQLEGTISRNKVGTSGDIIGVRPYRRGDSPRRIHWSQSAKHDRLIVCELQSNARPFVQIVLDLDSKIHRGTEKHSSREWAIRVVASLIQGWITQGVPIELVMGKQVFAAASGTIQLHRMLDALACLSNDETIPLAELLQTSAVRQFTQGVQVIVSTDLAVPHIPHSFDRDRRWVLFQADAFESTKAPLRPAPSHTWLWLQEEERIPFQLRHQLKEATHGS